MTIAWLPGEVWMKVGFVGRGVYMIVFEACTLGEKAVSGKRNVVGHGTRVPRYSFTPGSGNIGRRATPGTIFVSVFVRELTHGIQMRVSRDRVLPNGYL